MRHRSAFIILAMLISLILAGCTGNASNGQTPEGSTASQTLNIPKLPLFLLKEGWPVDSVPTELPEYTEGKVVNSGEDGGSVYIKIRDTDQKALGRYLDKLKGADWIVTGNSREAEAVNGLYTVGFTWQGGGTMLQMDLYIGRAGTWPSDKIPPDIIQPQTGTLVDEVKILSSIEDAWYFNYTYDEVDNGAAKRYMELLKENGWSGDDTMVYKSFEWNGKKYKADIEIYETVETRTTFTCNFYIAD